MYHQIEAVFEQVILYCTMAMEMAGVLIVVATAVRCLYGYVRGKQHLRIDLAEGI